jgi:hypothetical protein
MDVRRELAGGAGRFGADAEEEEGMGWGRAATYLTVAAQMGCPMLVGWGPSLLDASISRHPAKFNVNLHIRAPVCQCGMAGGKKEMASRAAIGASGHLPMDIGKLATKPLVSLLVQ